VAPRYGGGERSSAMRGENHIGSADVVGQDLRYVSRGLGEEFQIMGGRRLLITGGAGFLGHYLVQAPLHWNKGVEVTFGHISRWARRAAKSSAQKDELILADH
jgi:hypothetical protein